MTEEVVPLTSMWRRYAAERPDAPAVSIDLDTTVSWSRFQRETNQVARAFAAHDVRLGDFVSIGLPNSIDFVYAMVGALKVGAIPQPLSYRLPQHELRAILDLVRPALVIGFPDDLTGGWASTPTLPAYDHLDDSELDDVVAPSIKAPTSGGSTGRPKVIVAGQAAEVTLVDGAVPAGMLRGEVVLYPGPLYHNAAVNGTLYGLMGGQHVVLESRFDAETTLAAIDRHRVEFAMLVPTHMQRIQRLPEEVRAQYSLDSLQTLLHNAAPCPPDLKRWWIDWIGGDRLVDSYAATELGAAAATMCTGTEWLARPGTIGRPAAGEFRVLDENGDPAPRGAVGQIWLRRSPGTPPTYYYLGQETAERDDGWDTVGDLGWMDEDGYLYLADRRSDLIISGGANVYPAEVEGALLGHPGVLDCAVVGLPDDDLGRRVHAIVQLAPELDEATAEGELRAFLADRLVRYKTPRTYEWVSEPLRSEAGKMRRGQLVAERAQTVGS
jgi:bile acid-coenzyme A ligase